MAETVVIIDALKSALRARNITYATVAKHLQLSESSVKRLFARHDLSLKRLDEVCELAGIEISDLTRMAEESRSRIDQLDAETEQTLIEQSKLLLTAWCVLNYWSFDEILDYYDFESAELIKMFTTLDRLGIIELLPGNRVRLLVSANFKWRHGGPIERFFESEVQNRFLGSHFTRDDELRLVLTGMLTKVSTVEMIDRLKRVAESFDQTCSEDRTAPLDERRGTTLLVAVRPWLFEAFTRFEKNNHSTRHTVSGRT